MSGTAHGAGPALLRAALRCAEPFYAGAIRLRNGLFDARRRPIRRLPRPVISIGNITTGGTGKTPMVRWLAERLRAEGRCVAILSRGYRATGSGLGDELTMLDRSLNDSDLSRIWVRANPNRVAAGKSLLDEHPEVDVFLLDDGFQHRGLARDLDIVLISATEPFGFNHVLPRGLLREPLSALRRAGVVVLTHADQVPAEVLSGIESKIRRYASDVPLYRAAHVQVGLLETAVSTALQCRHPIEALADTPFFAFCGIGNPNTFHQQLIRFGGRYTGSRWFADHHSYTESDWQALVREAISSNAQMLITTEKDWVKIAPLVGAASLPVLRVELQLKILDDGEVALLNRVRSVFDRAQRQ
jgi:tetraacyldisaccharide 4'-kinase